MKRFSKKWIISKVLIYLLIYSILHFLYDLIPVLPIALISGTNESIFTHMKIGFYAYFFTCLVDYQITKTQIESKNTYFWNTLLMSSLMPLFLFALWYILPVFLEHLEPMWFELTYSFLILVINGIMAANLEDSYSKTEYSKNTKIIILLLFISSIIIYSGYTFKTPYIDVFYIPIL